jgi:hypothetical protein
VDVELGANERCGPSEEPPDEIDRGVEHVIDKKSGQIGKRNTYARSRDLRTSNG